MKKLCPTFLVVLVVLLVVSPTVLAVYELGIKRTPDGGYIFTWPTTFDGEQKGSALIKMDEEESVEWQKAYVKSSQEPLGIGSIDFTEDGGFVLFGTSATSNSSSPRPIQAYILRLGQDGNPIWQKELRKEDYQCELLSTTRTEDGGYMAAGGIGPVPPKETKDHDMDAWVVKVNEDGSVAWQYTYGGDLIDWAYEIIQTRDGGYLFTGETTEPLGRQSAGDLWVVKLDKTGSIEWQKSYGEPYELEYLCPDVGYSVIQMENSDYLVVGTTRSFREGGGAEGDIWILRLDNQGNIKWQKSYGGECLETTPILIESIGEGYLIGGSTTSFAPWRDISITEETCYTEQIWNGWLFEIDGDGRLGWQKVYGPEQFYGIHGIAHTTEGGYFIRGLIAKQSKIFKIDEKGNPVGKLDELNVASTDVTPKNTTTEPAETSVSPKPIEVNVLDLDLQVNETDISDIFLTEN
ncbi:MAG: hypothetical protein ACOC6I_03220 [Candidatus Bipolaricaulota bacterium]